MLACSGLNLTAVRPQLEMSGLPRSGNLKESLERIISQGRENG